MKIIHLMLVIYTRGLLGRSMDVQKSIIKKFRRKIWSKFVKVIKEYNLINESDKIAVCISGGKDSFLLAKCMEELKRHGQFKFDLEFICMDPGYKSENLIKIKENAKIMGIDLKIFNSDIFKVVENNCPESPCYLCARMRRGFLYDVAKKLGCNKIALGHHFNDVIETALLNIFYTGRFSGMPPKLVSDNFDDMELIRPLYMIKEEDIVSWANYNKLDFIDCACVISKKKSDSKRLYIKNLINELIKENKNVDINIFRSLENVNINTLNGYIKDNVKFLFNDLYNK